MLELWRDHFLCPLIKTEQDVIELRSRVTDNLAINSEFGSDCRNPRGEHPTPPHRWSRVSSGEVASVVEVRSIVAETKFHTGLVGAG